MTSSHITMSFQSDFYQIQMEKQSVSRIKLIITIVLINSLLKPYYRFNKFSTFFLIDRNQFNYFSRKSSYVNLSELR